MYYVYLLRCADGSLYTGITTDLSRRLAEHRSRSGRGARYTRSHPVLHLEAAFAAADRAQASRLEYRIKGLSRERKERLLQAPADCPELEGCAALSAQELEKLCPEGRPAWKKPAPNI